VANDMQTSMDEPKVIQSHVANHCRWVYIHAVFMLML